MVSKPEKTKEQMANVRVYLKDLENFGKIGIGEFKVDRKCQLAVLHALQLAIEGCLSIGAGIISADELGMPKDYADIFDILKKNDIIKPELSGKLMDMARFRNKMVHMYWQIDLDKVYDILNNRLVDMHDYLKAISGYLGS